MAQPPPYNRAFNFANQQALTPADPVPAPRIDEELNRVKLTLDQVLANLALIQRDDTAIRNKTIGYDQLKDELNGFGFNPPEEWATDTNYIARDTVFFDNSFYRAVQSHTSDVFATDLAAGKWALVADFTSATTEAVAARDKAQQWAENPEDSAVETGQFSALHHAAKSADSATASATSATAAAGSATAAANSATAADTSADAAAASAGTASGAAGTASTSAGNAMTSANAAAASATAAGNSATAAAASAAEAATFDPDLFETKWASKRDVNLAADYPTDTYVQISLHAVAGAGYSVRMLRGSGADGDFTIAQTGDGNFNLDGGTELLRDGSRVLVAADIGVDVQAYSAKLAGIVANTRPRFSAAKSVQQTGVSNATVTFPAEVFDIGGYYDTATSRWTPPAGIYKIGARALLSGAIAAGASYTLSIFKNGVAGFGRNQVRAAGAGGFSILVEDIVESNGTDYWEINLATSGAAINVEPAFQWTSFYGYEI